jgi:hypothetical protein
MPFGHQRLYRDRRYAFRPKASAGKEGKGHPLM